MLKLAAFSMRGAGVLPVHTASIFHACSTGIFPINNMHTYRFGSVVQCSPHSLNLQIHEKNRTKEIIRIHKNHWKRVISRLCGASL